MGKFLLGLFALVVVLFAAGDQWARARAEEEAERRIESNLDVRAGTDVSIGGWPFLWNAYRGNFPSVEVNIGRIEANGLTLRRLEIELQDIETSLSEILSGSSGAVRARSGRGTAVLTSDSLGGAVGARFPGLSGAEVSLDGPDLVLASSAIPEALRVRLPVFAEGLAYEEVRIEGDSALLQFSLENARLRSP